MPSEQRGGIYKTATGYGLRWYDEHGRRRRQAGFPSRSAARKWFEDVERKRMRGETPAPEPVTLVEHVDRYLDAHKVGRDPKTIDVLRFRLGYATSVFGELRLDELERRVAEVAAWMTTLPTGSRLLFPGPRGAHIDLRNWRKREWKPGLEAAGLTQEHRPYDLRHSYASWMLAAGVPAYDVARYIGQLGADARPHLRPPRQRVGDGRTGTAGRIHSRRTHPAGGDTMRPNDVPAWPENLKAKSILDVMREPIVIYRVRLGFSNGNEEIHPFDNKQDAVHSARMASGLAESIDAERVTLRVVEDIEPFEWRD